MSTKVRWGILGTGAIAGKFAEGLKAVPGAQLAACGSRAPATAKEFGAKFGVARCHGSYEALATDPDVDVIYIATPHPLHKANTLLCLERGKAVLCEKPFAINVHEAKAMVTLARQRQLLLVEAIWSRFLPHLRKMRELAAGGVIGEVRLLQADFGFRTGWEPEGRLLNPALGGGALLDVGIYPVSLAHMLFGKPERITGLAHLGATGVDEQAGMVLGFSGGQLAVLSTAVRTTTGHEAALYGTDGWIKVDAPWWRPSRLRLMVKGKEETLECPAVGNGYNYEAMEVQRCLAAGERETPVIPLDETLAVMQTLDELRAQWGLKYPVEP